MRRPDRERDVADREALRAANHLGAEQALERLAGEQMLAGKIRVEAQGRVVLAWDSLEDSENPTARCRVRDLKRDRP